MKFPLFRPRYYFSLFQDIVRFIKRPHSRLDLNKSVKYKVYDTIGIYILKMVFLIPVLLFFALVYDPENVQSISMKERFSPLVLLLVGGLILPLVEEVGFRLSLVFRPIYLSLSSSVLVYYILTKVVYHTKISMVDESFILRVIISLGAALILFIMLNIMVIYEKVRRFWALHFRRIFYASCLIFAWIHLSKYEVIWLNILLLPILTLPQLMSAIMYGYTRVSFGFRYPLILHMSTNVIAIGLSLLVA